MRTFEIVLVVAWVWTLATTILNVLLLPRLGRGRQVAGRGLVSVVIPARDEERNIGQTVRAMLAQTYSPLEVIVVDDRSSDGTGDILSGIAREDSRLVIVDGEETPPDWLGKPWACHQGCRIARGELLLIVDADVHYAPPAVAAIVGYMEALPEIAMAAVFPHFELVTFWEHIAMPMLPVTALMFLPSWLSNRTTIAAFGVGGGTGNMIRHRDFDDIGGYTALHNAVVDDVGMAQQLRARGKRTHGILADDLISLRMYHSAREIIDGFTKNVFTAFGGFFAMLTLLPMMIAFHLVPYLLALRGDVLALVVVGLITLCRLLAFAPFRLRIDNALFGHPLMIVIWSWIFFRSMWMTGVRKELQWRGRAYTTTWSRFGKER
jgi:chlorobactene glucosyltransferase